jgi:hypothetical protein
MPNESSGGDGETLHVYVAFPTGCGGTVNAWWKYADLEGCVQGRQYLQQPLNSTARASTPKTSILTVTTDRYLSFSMTRMVTAQTWMSRGAEALEPR